MSKPGQEFLTSRKFSVRTYRSSGILTPTAEVIVPPEGLAREVAAIRMLEVAGLPAIFDVYMLPPAVTTVAEVYKVLPTTPLLANQGYVEGSSPDAAIFELKLGWSLWARATSGSVVVYINVMDARRER